MFEFFFKYPRAVFRESELTLASTWPLWLFWAGIAISCVLLLTSLYIRWRRLQLAPWQLASLGSLQALMIMLLFLVVWQPALLTERLVRGENTVAILLDTSSSMTGVDSNATQGSRMDQALALLNEEGLREINETYTILRYGFTDRAEQLDSFSLDSLPDPGNASDLGNALLEALRQSSSTSLGAVILLSDGADNRGAIPQSVLNDITGYQVPVHTVGLGREQIPEDLELEEVVLPDQALPGSTLTARVRIRHDQGGTTNLKVYNGDTFLSSQTVTLAANEPSTLAYVDIDAEEAGQLDLSFELDPLDGERHLANNQRSRVVDVRASRYRILYAEGEPRWEYKFLRRALGDDPSIQLSTLLRVSTNRFYRQGIEDPEELADGFPDNPADLNRYDALIIGNVDAAELNAEQHALLRDFVSERGGTLLMLGGLNGLGHAGWSDSPVHAILPANLAANDSRFVREPVPVHLTDAGQASPVLQLDSNDDENRRLWSSMPDIADFHQLGALRPAASTLLEYEREGRRQPLLITQPYGRGHSWILATGGSWRWQMQLPSDDARHETFWRQLARALVANSPRPLELSGTVEDGSIHVRAEIRDPEAEENQGLALSAIVNGPEGELIDMDLLPVAGQPGHWEASFQPNNTGLYSIEAISRLGDEPVDSIRTATRFDQGDEAFNIRQNRPLLERLSSATGGRYWTAAQWDQLTEAIAFSDAGITEQELRYLWDAPFFFLMLFLLKAAEWLLRRRWSTI